MRTLLLTLALITGCPVWAEVTVQSLLIRRTNGSEVNIRVNLVNTGPRPTPAGTAMRLSLFIRPHSQAPWEPFKVWFLSPIKPGQRVARDYFFAGNQRLNRLALDNPLFEVKARLTRGDTDTEKITISADPEALVTGPSPGKP